MMNERKKNYLLTLQKLDREGQIILSCLSCKTFDKYIYDDLLTKYNEEYDIFTLICKKCHKESIIPIIHNISLSELVKNGNLPYNKDVYNGITTKHNDIR